MNEKSIKLIQELLSGKAVLLTDENLENFLQKCKLTCSDKEEDDRDYLGLPRFVTGLKSLAAILKVSLSTVSRWKAKGLLDTVTFQDGKSVFFDMVYWIFYGCATKRGNTINRSITIKIDYYEF